jgi:hypothetical protein
MTDRLQYAVRMGFRGNTALFEAYVELMARLLGRNPRAILGEIAERLVVLNGKPYSRYFMLQGEAFLYTLPLVKAVQENPDALVAFNGLSVEPFYRAFRSWAELLLPGRAHPAYLHIERHGDLEHVPLLPRSILPLLTVEEAQAQISDADWEAIERAAGDLGSGLDEHLRRLGAVGGLEALRRKRASRGKLIQAIADFGLDERFIYFYQMALHSRFGDFCKGEELNGTESGVPIERVIGWARAHNETLEYPLNADDMTLLEEGVRRLGGRPGRVYGFERSGLHKYMITFGDIRKAARLKNSMGHAARPILNLLLGKTAFAKRLADASGSARKVFYVDQTMTSGVSFLVWELVFRAFRQDTAGRFITITQHTADSRNILLEHHFLDQIGTSGIWPQENNLGYYDGLFLDLDGTGARYRTFQQLLGHLKAKHRECGLATAAEPARELAMLNSDLEEFVRSCGDLFDFIDAAQSLRFDRLVIKRQTVKALLRPGDDLEAALLKKYYLLSASVFEEDFIGSYLLREGMERLNTPELLASIPQGIKDRDRAIRYFDQAELVEQLARHAQDRLQRCADIRDCLMSGASCGELVRAYLGGRASFEELERGYYDRCPAPGSQAWAW